MLFWLTDCTQWVLLPVADLQQDPAQKCGLCVPFLTTLLSAYQDPAAVVAAAVPVMDTTVAEGSLAAVLDTAGTDLSCLVAEEEVDDTAAVGLGTPAAVAGTAVEDPGEGGHTLAAGKAALEAAVGDLAAGTGVAGGVKAVEMADRTAVGVVGMAGTVVVGMTVVAAVDRDVDVGIVHVAALLGMAVCRAVAPPACTVGSAAAQGGNLVQAEEAASEGQEKQRITSIT